MNIHSTAIVSPNAKLGKNITIGAFSIIHENVQIDDNTIIEAYCELGVANQYSEGQLLKIGADSLIRSRSTFYEGSVFGEQLVTGHNVTVREKTIAGKNLQIGTLSDIQGHCHIGDYVRFHSNVHIGQQSKIGNFVWIFPYVVLTNDPHPPSNLLKGVTIEDYVAIATMTTILPATRIGKGALVGAHSLVNKNVEPEIVVAGSPAKFICLAEKIKLQDGTDRPTYPWITHFHRGYPEEVVREWLGKI